MNPLSRLRSSVVDAARGPMLVRCRTSFATIGDAFDIGSAYELPASSAMEYIRAGYVSPIDGEDELKAAAAEISLREMK